MPSLERSIPRHLGRERDAFADQLQLGDPEAGSFHCVTELVDGQFVERPVLPELVPRPPLVVGARQDVGFDGVGVALELDEALGIPLVEVGSVLRVVEGPQLEEQRAVGPQDPSDLARARSQDRRCARTPTR